jgi:hypothetical protein
VSNLYDFNKKGTLVLSYYRSGTHYLQDAIVAALPKSRRFDEICNDGTVDQLLKTDNQYMVAIMNSVEPKFNLVAHPEILDDWHVVKLTRRNKVQHFISYWFWEQNTMQQRFDDTGKFKHHGTDNIAYTSAITQKQHYDISAVKNWLQEQLVLEFLPYNYTIDYDDLHIVGLDTTIRWQPNQYGNIALTDLFTNGDEIQDLLENFKYEK